MLLNLYYGKKSASQVSQSSRCCCAESSGVSSELHSSWWWYPAAPMEQQKIYLPLNSYIKRTGIAFDVVKTTGLVYHPSSKIGSGEQVTSSPFPSNSTSNCAAIGVRTPQLFNPSRKDLSRKRPAAPCQPPAALGQRFVIWVPVAVSTCSSSVLPAKNWANLFSISTDQGKKSFKKGKIEFGNLIPWRVSNGSFSLPLLQVSAFITSPCQCYYEETNSIMRSFPIWEPK